MSAKERQKRMDKATYEGRVAFREGKPMAACPYKHSEWGMGWHWDNGWRKEKADTLVLDLQTGVEVDKYLKFVPAQWADGYNDIPGGAGLIIRQTLIRKGMPPLRLVPSKGVLHSGKLWACVEITPDPIVPAMYTLTFRKNVEVPKEEYWIK